MSVESQAAVVMAVRCHDKDEAAESGRSSRLLLYKNTASRDKTRSLGVEVLEGQSSAWDCIKDIRRWIEHQKD